MLDSQYKSCNLILDDLMKKVGDTQMRREEYAYISSFLKESNFLIFGTGHDSNYWRCTNKLGRTVFLEDDLDWIDESKDIFKISYNTQRSEYKELLKEFLNGDDGKLKIDLPKIILDVQWDVILVDAPMGTNHGTPGRMQSIYLASKLANIETDIFIHDCDRTVEDVYGSVMFSKRIKQLFKLRHLRI